jgi:hypothetical protein
MKTNTKSHQAEHCERTRLAESSVAAIDVSECGMMQLHIGPITVRLAVCAACELLDTLSRAVDEYERQHPSQAAVHDVPLFGGGRGSA